MQLMLQRNQQPQYWGQPLYLIHLNLLLEDDEQDIIVRHGLTTRPLYAVPEIEDHKRLADEAFERSVDNDCLTEAGAQQFVSNVATSLYHNISAWRGYRVLVRDAINGTTITCTDLFELLACERAITTAFDELASAVSEALAFDVAREQIHVPDNQADEPTGTPARAWADHFRWRR